MISVTKRNPIEFLINWYFLWIFFAVVVTFISWDSPIPGVIFIFLGLISLLAVSFIASGVVFRSDFVFTRSVLFQCDRNVLRKLCSRLLIIYAVLVLILGGWMAQFFLSANNLIDVRMAAFDIKLFDNIYLAAAHNILLSYVSLLASICVSINLVLFRNSRSFMILVFIALIHSLVTLGRVPILLVVLAYLLVVFILPARSRPLKSALVFVAVILFFAIIENLRTSSNSINSFDNLFTGIQGIIEYGVTSFFLVEALLADRESFLYLPHSFGLSMMGPVDTLVVFVQRELGFESSAVSGKNGGYLREFVFIASDFGGNPIYANAAGSFFTTLFRDGGYYLVFLSPLPLGFYLRYLQARARFSDFHSIQLFFVIFLAVASLFQSQIEAISIVVIFLTPLFLRFLLLNTSVTNWNTYVKSST